ncbi:MAG: hypothetical protein V1874_15530 [Spirochaetota bacterium]
MNKLFKLFAITLATAFIFTACGGSSSDSSGGGSTPVFNGGVLLPNGVNATVSGDSYSCYMQYDSNCMSYACDISCYNTWQTQLAGLDPDDPNYDAQAAALEATYESCSEACYAGCDMTSSFLITITLTNTTTSTVTVTLPAGLTFVPSDSGYQPMMIIKEVTITITSQQTKTTCLPVFCLNLSAHAPDEEAYYTGYNIVLPTGTGCLSEIMDILAGVDFAQLEYSDYQAIQDVIWDCTSGGVPDLDFLNNLPDKSITMSKTSSTSSSKYQKKCAECSLKKLKLIK